ncbi:MAG: OmpH family outer membrane protein [Candidatus Aadella gelida]|nr:OmpH family outer membrane protein [Candidatus Aadella gelida]
MTNLIKKTLITVIVSLMLVSGIALTGNAADGSKIGYVDFRRAFYENDKAKGKEDELRDYEETKKEEQTVMIQEITQMRDEAELLSDAEKAKKRKELEAKMVTLQGFENEVRKELQTKKNDIYREIADDIQNVVDEVGKNGGYDYILDSRSVIFAGEESDVTDEVIKNLKEKK